MSHFIIQFSLFINITKNLTKTCFNFIPCNSPFRKELKFSPNEKPLTALAKEYVSAADPEIKTEIYNKVETTEIEEFWRAVI
jgi:hypothetical protein